LSVFREAFEARFAFARDVGDEVNERLMALDAFVGLLFNNLGLFHGVGMFLFAFKECG